MTLTGTHTRERTLSGTTAVWLVLVGATCTSWAVGAEAQLPHAPASLCILAIAAVKARLVGLWFMELRHAPRLLRLLYEGWCGGVFLLLAGLYLLGS